MKKKKFFTIPKVETYFMKNNNKLDLRHCDFESFPSKKKKKKEEKEKERWKRKRKRNVSQKRRQTSRFLIIMTRVNKVPKIAVVIDIILVASSRGRRDSLRVIAFITPPLILACISEMKITREPPFYAPLSPLSFSFLGGPFEGFARSIKSLPTARRNRLR